MRIISSKNFGGRSQESYLLCNLLFFNGVTPSNKTAYTLLYTHYESLKNLSSNKLFTCQTIYKVTIRSIDEHQNLEYPKKN